MDNPETQTLEKTEESIKNGQSRDADVRENRRVNQEWTCQRHKTTRKTQKMDITDTTKNPGLTQVLAKGKHVVESAKRVDGHREINQ
jgi:hypothetical protein